ncbi:transcriptional regulator [Thermomicrobium sp. 4228-Ro]|uniref:winged helix-turn-helix domain-containing protein n=1 Tax=Thermomicrobium sp. 4228-Ro TaxID=2993937 RepID=UPI002249833D|nr:transcriptional regulator [Thermomicrobium sp. 4228-Ro]MCX2728180.1 transcriptional regulator [Thermomicrobium sp. 4228-Ro]
MTLDELIHQPTRLRIMAALAALAPNSEVEFTYLRDLLELTDGNLSAHLLRLEEAGYVRSRKTFVGRKPRTYVALTPRGRAAFESHRAALLALLSGQAPQPDGTPGTTDRSTEQTGGTA